MTLKEGKLSLSLNTMAFPEFLGLVQSIDVSLQGRFVLAARYYPELAETPAPFAPMLMAIAPAEAAPQPNASCKSGWICKRRTLHIQPVVFTKRGAITGRDLVRQLESARTVWNKACFTLVQDAKHSITNQAKLFDSDNVTDIMSCYTAPNGVIPVFFVASNVAGWGGGATTDRGTRFAKVVVSDNVTRMEDGERRDNPNLLAHEMGHVLGGRDPNESSGGWEAHLHTVMHPGGAPWRPIPAVNTLGHCLGAYNSAEVLDETKDDCLTPDPDPAPS